MEKIRKKELKISFYKKKLFIYLFFEHRGILDMKVGSYSKRV